MGDLEQMRTEGEIWQRDIAPVGIEIARQKTRINRRAWEDEHTKTEKTDIEGIGIFCRHCKEEITTNDDCYYKCCIHKHWHTDGDHIIKEDEVFCKTCATKQGEFTKDDFPKCQQQLVDGKECIWNKISI